jgi:hypothetical protein
MCYVVRFTEKAGPLLGVDDQFALAQLLGRLESVRQQAL